MKLKDINRRKALSSLIKGGLGAAAVFSSIGKASASDNTSEKEAKTKR